jgi:hypothetical protein
MVASCFLIINKLQSATYGILQIQTDCIAKSLVQTIHNVQAIHISQPGTRKMYGIFWAKNGLRADVQAKTGEYQGEKNINYSK